MNKTIGQLAQTGAALWILNVWFLRFDKNTGYRGGDADNMTEEFANYGLPPESVWVVGSAKVGLALLMLIGLRVPKLARPASLGLAAFMVGALAMHAKVGDPLKRSIPAISTLAASLTAAALADGGS
ncbi:MAG: DoxX family protein [Ilumatobacter sp.]